MKFRIVIFTICVSMLAVGSACKSATNKAANQGLFSNANSNVPATDPGLAPPEDSGPEGLVTDLYKHHDRYTGPFNQTTSRPRVDKYFTKELADLIWKDSTTSKGAVGAIEADPLYDAQDIDIYELKVGDPTVNSDTATVPVTFENYEKKQTVTFALVKVDGAWRIDDIKYSRGDSLRKWLEDAYAGPAGSISGFDGKYKVGETTCTVKPVQMQFAVSCEDGKGGGTYTPREGNTFESPANKGTTNRFAFTNDKCDSGMFYRADGEILPVKRSK